MVKSAATGWDPVWLPGMRIEVKRDAVMSGGRARTTGIQSWQGGD